MKKTMYKRETKTIEDKRKLEEFVCNKKYLKHTIATIPDSALVGNLSRFVFLSLSHARLCFELRVNSKNKFEVVTFLQMMHPGSTKRILCSFYIGSQNEFLDYLKTLKKNLLKNSQKDVFSEVARDWRIDVKYNSECRIESSKAIVLFSTHKLSRTNLTQVILFEETVNDLIYHIQREVQHESHSISTWLNLFKDECESIVINSIKIIVKKIVERCQRCSGDMNLPHYCLVSKNSDKMTWKFLTEKLKYAENNRVNMQHIFKYYSTFCQDRKMSKTLGRIVDTKLLQRVMRGR